MNLKRTLPILLLGLTLSSCNDAPKAGAVAGQRLHAAGEIAVEIEQAHKLKAHPYYRIAEEAGHIELLVADPNLDHQSIANEISNLKSVKSFDGKLFVVFRHPENESVQPTMWIKYDAKTGQKIEQ